MERKTSHWLLNLGHEKLQLPSMLYKNLRKRVIVIQDAIFPVNRKPKVLMLQKINVSLSHLKRSQRLMFCRGFRPQPESPHLQYSQDTDLKGYTKCNLLISNTTHSRHYDARLTFSEVIYKYQPYFPFPPLNKVIPCMKAFYQPP